MRDADGLSCESIKEDLKTECEEAKASFCAFGVRSSKGSSEKNSSRPR